MHQQERECHNHQNSTEYTSNSLRMEARKTDCEYSPGFLASDHRIQEGLQKKRTTVQTCAVGSRALRGQEENETQSCFTVLITKVTAAACHIHQKTITQKGDSKTKAFLEKCPEKSRIISPLRSTQLVTDLFTLLSLRDKIAGSLQLCFHLSHDFRQQGN